MSASEFKARPITLPPRNGFPPIAALRAFDAIARLGGIRRAAEALAMDHAAVSRQARSLEAWTGTAMLVKTRNGVALTDAGLRYHAALGPILESLAAATLGLSTDRHLNRLRIWCAPDFAAQWLSQRFGRFRDAHPGFDVELRPSESAPSFACFEADVHIRFVPDGIPVADEGPTRSEVLDNPDEYPVASPDYLASKKEIRGPADILQHTLLHERDTTTWQMWLRANGVMDCESLGGPRLWRGQLTMEAARRGEGIAIASHFIATDDLAAGRLVRLDGNKTPFRTRVSGPYVFTARADRWRTQTIDAFRGWLIDTIGAEKSVHVGQCGQSRESYPA